MDTCLPFGLRSTPKLFTSLADALEWVLSSKGVEWSIHYIDDFLTAGRPGTDECSRYLDRIKFTCADLGVPLKLTKIVGPSPVIEFLGITVSYTVGRESFYPSLACWLMLARSFELVAFSFVVSLTIP